MHTNRNFNFRSILILTSLFIYLGCANQINVTDGWDKVSDILDTITVPQFQDKDFLITDYGAIADGSTAMDVKLYTGNGSTQTISGLNFSPDLVTI